MDNFCKMVYDEVRIKYHVDEKVKITTPEDILRIKQVVDLASKKQEYFNLITLDGGSNVIRCRNITKGLLNYLLIHPREIFRPAISDSAHSIICVHNHPSGSMEPSSEDIKVTKQILESGKIIGIELLDHIIISRDGIQSMKSLGYV